MKKSSSFLSLSVEAGLLIYISLTDPSTDLREDDRYDLYAGLRTNFFILSDLLGVEKISFIIDKTEGE